MHTIVLYVMSGEPKLYYGSFIILVHDTTRRIMYVLLLARVCMYVHTVDKICEVYPRTCM